MRRFSNQSSRLRRRQLDTQLGRIDRDALRVPPAGWVRTIRDALGINGRQLAERLGISRSHLSHIEKAEQSSAVTMQTLHRVADGLGCDLLYVLVPRAGTLQETLDARARDVATSLVDRVAGSMTLEDQRTDAEARRHLIETTAAELVRTLDRTLWDPRP